MKQSLSMATRTLRYLTRMPMAYGPHSVNTILYTCMGDFRSPWSKIWWVCSPVKRGIEFTGFMPQHIFYSGRADILTAVDSRLTSLTTTHLS